MILYVKKTFFGFIIFLILLGCSAVEPNNLNEKASYGVILTSSTQSKSYIKLFSNHWKTLTSLTLNVGGIQDSVISNNIIFAPVLGTPTHPENKILVYNLKSKKVKYLKTELFPIKLIKKDNYLYVLHNSKTDQACITKIDIKHNKILNKVTLKGTAKFLINGGTKIIAITDNVTQNSQSIFQLNPDLNILKQDINTKTAFTTDAKSIGNDIYIMNVAKNDFSGPTNLLTIYNINKNNISTIPLESTSPYQVFSNKNSIFISHYDPPTNNGNNLTKIDLKTKRRKLITLNNALYQSILTKNKFISITSDGTVFEYNLGSFKKVNTTSLRVGQDIIVSDLFSLQ